MIVTMIGHKGVPSRSGGIERHVEELSTALVRFGVRVISFDRAWYVGALPSPLGIERRFSRGMRTKHLDALTHTFTALVLARRDHPDIIHVHGVGPSLLLPIARLLHPRTRLIATFHCVDRKHAKWGLFARLMLRLGEASACVFADRTITVSEALASYCLETYQCQSVSIPNGVRVPSVPDTGTLDAFGVMPKRYFLMATRLVPHKNVHVAIEAYRRLAERHPECAAAHPLIIAGSSAWTDAYVRTLRRQAADAPSVLLVGERLGNELAALQAHATCHLSVASSEGMSLSLLEAAAFGRPVIVSDIPENVEVTGSVMPRVPVGDAETLSDAMECVATLSDAERDEAGARLHARVMERHDWNRIAEQTLNVYRDVLAGQERVFVIGPQAS